MTKRRETAPEAQDAGQAPAAETAEGEGAAGGGPAAAAPSHDELLLTLQDARSKAEEYWNQLLRARAEIANVQRRAERDLENAHKYGLERFAVELLPVIDSLELGLGAAAQTDAELGKVREGIELTLKMMCAALEKFGIRAVDPQGERFDPAYHQAMTTRQEAGVEANTVLAVYQKGYLLNDRLIRPAMVVVSSVPNKDAGSEVAIDELA